jgi:hypothetical protein
MSGASAGYHLMPPLNTNLCPHLRRPVDRSQAEQSYNQFPDTELPTTRSELTCLGEELHLTLRIWIRASAISTKYYASSY